MPTLRCRCCSAVLTKPSPALLCRPCKVLGSGGTLHVRPGVWRLARWRANEWVQMGRIRHVQELVEEIRSRGLLLIVAAVLLAYAMSLTSPSLLLNLPVALGILAVARWLMLEVQARANASLPRVHYEQVHAPFQPITSADALPRPSEPAGLALVGSPLVEASLDEFVRSIIRDFVTNQFYAYLTPDREMPEELRCVLLAVLGEVARRAKRVNLVALLTRDVVGAVVGVMKQYHHACAQSLPSLPHLHPPSPLPSKQCSQGRGGSGGGGNGAGRGGSGGGGNGAVPARVCGHGRGGGRVEAGGGRGEGGAPQAHPGGFGRPAPCMPLCGVRIQGGAEASGSTVGAGAASQRCTEQGGALHGSRAPLLLRAAALPQAGQPAVGSALKHANDLTCCVLKHFLSGIVCLCSLISPTLSRPNFLSLSHPPSLPRSLAICCPPHHRVINDAILAFLDKHPSSSTSQPPSAPASAPVAAVPPTASPATKAAAAATVAASAAAAAAVGGGAGVSGGARTGVDGRGVGSAASAPVLTASVSPLSAAAASLRQQRQEQWQQQQQQHQQQQQQHGQSQQEFSPQHGSLQGKGSRMGASLRRRVPRSRSRRMRATGSPSGGSFGGGVSGPGGTYGAGAFGGGASGGRGSSSSMRRRAVLGLGGDSAGDDDSLAEGTSDGGVVGMGFSTDEENGSAHVHSSYPARHGGAVAAAGGGGAAAAGAGPGGSRGGGGVREKRRPGGGSGAADSPQIAPPHAMPPQDKPPPGRSPGLLQPMSASSSMASLAPQLIAATPLPPHPSGPSGGFNGSPGFGGSGGSTAGGGSGSQGMLSSSGEKHGGFSLHSHQLSSDSGYAQPAAPAAARGSSYHIPPPPPDVAGPFVHPNDGAAVAAVEGADGVGPRCGRKAGREREVEGKVFDRVRSEPCEASEMCAAGGRSKGEEVAMQLPGEDADFVQALKRYEQRQLQVLDSEQIDKLWYTDGVHSHSHSHWHSHSHSTHAGRHEAGTQAVLKEESVENGGWERQHSSKESIRNGCGEPDWKGGTEGGSCSKGVGHSKSCQEVYYGEREGEVAPGEEQEFLMGIHKQQQQAAPPQVAPPHSHEATRNGKRERERPVKGEKFWRGGSVKEERGMTDPTEAAAGSAGSGAGRRTKENEREMLWESVCSDEELGGFRTAAGNAGAGGNNGGGNRNDGARSGRWSEELEIGVAVRGLGFLVEQSPGTMQMMQRKGAGGAAEDGEGGGGRGVGGGGGRGGVDAASGGGRGAGRVRQGVGSSTGGAKGVSGAQQSQAQGGWAGVWTTGAFWSSSSAAGSGAGAGATAGGRGTAGTISTPQVTAAAAGSTAVAAGVAGASGVANRTQGETRPIAGSAATAGGAAAAAGSWLRFIGAGPKSDPGGRAAGARRDTAEAANTAAGGMGPEGGMCAGVGRGWESSVSGAGGRAGSASQGDGGGDDARSVLSAAAATAGWVERNLAAFGLAGAFGMRGGGGGDAGEKGGKEGASGGEMGGVGGGGSGDDRVLLAEAAERDPLSVVRQWEAEEEVEGVRERREWEKQGERQQEQKQQEQRWQQQEQRWQQQEQQGVVQGWHSRDGVEEGKYTAGTFLDLEGLGMEEEEEEEEGGGLLLSARVKKGRSAIRAWDGPGSRSRGIGDAMAGGMGGVGGVGGVGGMGLVVEGEEGKEQGLRPAWLLESEWLQQQQQRREEEQAQLEMQQYLGMGQGGDSRGQGGGSRGEEQSKEMRSFGEGRQMHAQIVGAFSAEARGEAIVGYSIAVTGLDGSAWIVRRRYRNFWQLHQQLKRRSPSARSNPPQHTLSLICHTIPPPTFPLLCPPRYRNFWQLHQQLKRRSPSASSLQLPPKRFFHGGRDEELIRDRLLQLHAYVKGIMTREELATSPEVIDFLSPDSKAYDSNITVSKAISFALSVDEVTDDLQWQRVKSTSQLQLLSTIATNGDDTSSVATSPRYSHRPARPTSSRHVAGMGEKEAARRAGIGRQRQEVGSDGSGRSGEGGGGGCRVGLRGREELRMVKGEGRPSTVWEGVGEWSEGIREEGCETGDEEEGEGGVLGEERGDALAGREICSEGGRREVDGGLKRRVGPRGGSAIGGSLMDGGARGGGAEMGGEREANGEDDVFSYGSRQSLGGLEYDLQRAQGEGTQGAGGEADEGGRVNQQKLQQWQQQNGSLCSSSEDDDLCQQGATRVRVDGHGDGQGTGGGQGGSGFVGRGEAPAGLFEADGDCEDDEDEEEDGVVAEAVRLRGLHVPPEQGGRVERGAEERDGSVRRHNEGSALDATVPADWTAAKLSAPLLRLVEVLLHLDDHGWIRRQVVWVARQVLELSMGDAIDDFLLSQIQKLRTESTVATIIRSLHQRLWPDGIFYSRHPNYRASVAASSSRTGSSAPAVTRPDPLGLNVPPESFQQRLEAADKAARVHQLLLEMAPASIVPLIGLRHYQRSVSDLFSFVQSQVCVKQLAHALLEVVILALFPELHVVVAEIRHGLI
ncbi:unnamed protein product [Closterium sp. NIES-53]